MRYKPTVKLPRLHAEGQAGTFSHSQDDPTTGRTCSSSCRVRQTIVNIAFGTCHTAASTVKPHACAAQQLLVPAHAPSPHMYAVVYIPLKLNTCSHRLQARKRATAGAVLCFFIRNAASCAAVCRCCSVLSALHVLLCLGSLILQAQRSKQHAEMHYRLQLAQSKCSPAVTRRGSTCDGANELLLPAYSAVSHEEGASCLAADVAPCP
jgi:hypothetical protein